MNDPVRAKQSSQYIALLRDGAAPKEAFEKAFAATYQQIGDQMKPYLSRGLRYMQFNESLTQASKDVAITPMPASADGLLLPLLRVRLEGVPVRGATSPERDALYADTKAKASPFAGDALADRVLAYDEVYLGDPARAKPLLDAALARDPNDVDALYLMGMMYLAQADRGGEKEAENLKQGRSYLVKVYKITQTNVPMLYYYAMSYMRRGRLTENQLNVLLLAQNLAPQVDTIGMNAAAALINAKRPNEAEPILKAIAGNPHGGGAADAARDLLKKLAADTDSAPN
jgi:tetratricopeptide (TPR) repeat protein